MFIILFFILGAIFGSFINCLIYRLYSKKTIFGRSFCPHCKHTLGVLDLFPIFSYLFLGCRCKYCKKIISFQYFFVEFITALIFAIGYYFYFQSGLFISSHIFLNFALYLIISLFLIMIFIYDVKYYLVKDEIIYPAILIALIFNILLAKNIINILIAGMIGFVFFGMQYFISKGKWVGGGDMFIGLLMGFLLGFPNILMALFLSYIFGSIVAIPLLIFKKKTTSSIIPLGPFLVLATFIVMLFGNVILRWYLNLFL